MNSGSNSGRRRRSLSLRKDRKSKTGNAQPKPVPSNQPFTGYSGVNPVGLSRHRKDGRTQAAEARQSTIAQFFSPREQILPTDKAQMLPGSGLRPIASSKSRKLVSSVPATSTTATPATSSKIRERPRSKAFQQANAAVSTPILAPKANLEDSEPNLILDDSLSQPEVEWHMPEPVLPKRQRLGPVRSMEVPIAPVRKTLDDVDVGMSLTMEDAVSETMKKKKKKGDKNTRKRNLIELIERIDKCVDEEPADEWGVIDPSLFTMSAEVEAELLMPTNETNKGGTPAWECGQVLGFTRCKVLSVKPQTEPVQIVVGVQEDTDTGAPAVLLLRGQWTAIPVNIGNIVNVIGEFIVDEEANRVFPGSSRVLVLDDTGPELLILHPDTLISGTMVSQSVSCLRESVLSDFIKLEARDKRPMIIGIIVHDLFEHAIQTPNCTVVELERLATQLTREHIEELYSARTDESEIMVEVAKRIPVIQSWLAKFTKGECVGGESIRIEHAVNVEEMFWSLMYGLKGIVDVSLRVEHENRSEMMPLELKSGSNKSSLAHRAQVILYTLAMAEKYDIPISMGLLVYVEKLSTIKVAFTENEVRGLIITRNQFADYVGRSSPDIEDSPLRLPQMLGRDAYRCTNFCDKFEYCAIIHHSLEDGTAETSGFSEIFEEITRHMKPEYVSYVRHWMNVLHYEEREKRADNKGIWVMSAKDRAHKGYCLFSMRISGGDDVNMSFSPITKAAKAAKCLSDTSICVGDMVVVSVDRDVSESDAHTYSFIKPTRPCFGVVRGRVVSLTQSNIMLEIDGKLRSPPDLIDKPITMIPWRIDRLEIGTSFAQARAYVISMFLGNPRLAELIVDLDPPQLELSSLQDLALPDYDLSQQSPLPPQAPTVLPESLRREWTKLNRDQSQAVRAVLAAQDYTLILGMPGTGKTAVIAFIVRALVALGRTVLLASYTHTAVDNILMKLMDQHGNAIIPFLRVGKPRQVHDSIAPFTLSELAKKHPITTVGHLTSLVESRPVVGSTVLGVRSPLLCGRDRKFDVCIVDEAGQIAEPFVLGPIRQGNRFVLVGDHHQLPPLIVSQQARDAGGATSLFKRLCEAHPNAVVRLRYQYRMNADIMTLPNELVYDGLLMCGSDAVANARLQLPHETYVNEWTDAVMSPLQSVVFLDTDDVPAIETREPSGVLNIKEASIVSTITNAFISSGIHSTDIGIITPYRAQLKILSTHLGHIRGLEMSTVDRYQGRDKTIIIMSFVRSNPDSHVGRLLDDWRRLNVAFSRAKQKLVLVGSLGTLSGSQSETLSKMTKLVRDKGWIVPVVQSVPSLLPETQPSFGTRRAVAQVLAAGK